MNTSPRQIGLGTFKATNEMIVRINQVLRSGRLSYGPMSQEFEQRLAAMHGCKYGVLSNSGTSSLLVALQTLKHIHNWQAGDEVLVPAVTFVATVNIVLQARLKPVLVDVEPDYYGMDPALIDRSITRRSRAIIPVHTFGQPCQMDDIKAIAAIHKLRILEDACETMLATFGGRLVGSFGDIGVFSSYVAHILVTGVGGIAITNNPDYAQYMRSLVNHGIDLSGLPSGEAYDATWFNRKFCFVRPGHSFRLTEMEAALGLAQLNDLPAIIETRQKNAAYLTRGLTHLKDRLQLPAVRPDASHSFMMYPLVCLQDGRRDNLMKHLNDNGIGTRLMLPLTRQPVYNGLWQADKYPVADWINKNGFYTASHQGLTQADLDYIIEKVEAFYDGR